MPAVPVADMAISVVLTSLTCLMGYVWQPQSLLLCGFKQVIVFGLAVGSVFFFSLAVDYWLMIKNIKRGSTEPLNLYILSHIFIEKAAQNIDRILILWYSHTNPKIVL